jgi:hypothetical protein
MLFYSEEPLWLGVLGVVSTAFLALSANYKVDYVSK